MTFAFFLLAFAAGAAGGIVAVEIRVYLRRRAPFHDLTQRSEETAEIMHRSIVDPYVGEFPAVSTLPEDKNKTDGLFAILRKTRHR